jgi:hypothetical protein
VAAEIDVPQAGRGRGLNPETVANRLDFSLSEVYHALAYYHDHPEEMRAVEEDRERVREMVVAFSNPIL